MLYRFLKLSVFIPLVLSSVACAADKPASQPTSQLAPAEFKPASPLKAATEQVTFLYYNDLAAPRAFYGKTLGLNAYYDQEWVTLYRVTDSATIGVVKLGREDLKAAQKRDAVMVSIVTDDVDGWYNRLKEKPGVVFQKQIYNHPAVPIRAFLLQDPGGYSVEFLQWLK